MPRSNRDSWSKDYDHIIENAKDAPPLEFEKLTFRKTWTPKDETVLVRQFGKVPELPVCSERGDYALLANGFLACDQVMTRSEASKSTPMYTSDYFDYAQHQKKMYRNALDNQEKLMQVRAINPDEKLVALSQDGFYNLLEDCVDYISWHSDFREHSMALRSQDPTNQVCIFRVREWKDTLKRLEPRRRCLVAYRGPNASAGRVLTWESQDQDPEPEPAPKRGRKPRRPMSPTEPAPKRGRKPLRSLSPTEPQPWPGAPRGFVIPVTRSRTPQPRPAALRGLVIPVPRSRTPEPMTTPPQASSPPKPVSTPPRPSSPPPPVSTPPRPSSPPPRATRPRPSSPPKPVSTEPEPDSQETQLQEGEVMPVLARYVPPPPPAKAAVPAYESEEESDSMVLEHDAEEPADDSQYTMYEEDEYFSRVYS